MNPENLFTEGSEALGAFDIEGLKERPIQEAALAVKQILGVLEGSEERVFHCRMRVLRVARQLELWKLDTDPDVGEKFVTMKRWIQALWPKSYRYAVDAWETEEALADLPMKDLTEITGANLRVLRQVSSGVRSKKAVLKAAKGMTKEQFETELTNNYGQHIEPVRVMPKVDAAEFERALLMVEAVEECNRAEALKKIATLIIQEYAAAYEHCEKTA